jgi:hypothetical protein
LEKNKMNKNISFKLFSIASLLVLIFSVRIVHPTTASISPISIMAVPGASDSVVYTITRVYQAPDDASRVIDVLSPGTHFNILGYNDSGTFIAVAKEGQSLTSGWIPTSQVTRAYLSGTSRSLSLGYLSPNSTSRIETVLTPGQEVKVLGHSPDGSWLAIENPTSLRTPLYWVARQDIGLPSVVAKTSSLTMVYAKPTNGSLIMNVLIPTYQLVLIGRTSDNARYAAEDFISGKYIGWVMSSDLAGGSNRELLPVTPLK